MESLTFTNMQINNVSRDQDRKYSNVSCNIFFANAYGTNESIADALLACPQI